MAQSLEKQAEEAAAAHAAAAATTESPEHDVAPERTPLPMRRIQRQAGNRAAATMARRTSSLQVGPADDRFEREADSVADRVVAALQGGVVGPAQGQVIDVGAAPAAAPQRKAASGPTETTQVGLEGGPVGADFEQGLARARTGGSAIDTPVRRRMEGAIGADLSGVRLHAGTESSQLNDQVQAKAFTVGSDIFFRDGLPDTSSAEGQQLLAHEVTHTLQQSGGAQRQVQRFWNPFKKKDATPERGTMAATNAASAKGTQQPAEESDGFDTAEGVNEAMVTPIGTTSIITGGDAYANDMNKARGKGGKQITKTGIDEGGAYKLDTAAGAGEFLGMFFSIAAAVKSFREAEKGSDTLMAGMEGTHAVLSGSSAMAKMVDSGSKASGKYGRDIDQTTGEDNGAKSVGESSKAATALGGIADGFGAIKEGFYVVKGIADLVTDANEMSDEEKFKASMEIIRHSLEAAKSAVSSAKSFLDMAGGSVTAEMIGSIPGLGIAISCADLIVRAYDLIQANVRAYDMRDRKREMKLALGGTQGKSSKAEAERILQSTDPADADKKEMAQEYLASKGLEYINRKRSNRALLKITVAMTKIAGDAATIGGASAPVGIGLKVGALALDVGASVFRRFKQWARDTVAESEDKAEADHKAKSDAAVAAGGSALAAREKGFFARIFNTDKSSAKKEAEYNTTVDRVFAMISKVDTTTDLSDPATPAAKKTEIEKQANKVGAYLEAMDYPLTAMKRDIGKDATGAKVRENMIKALKKRE